MPQAGQAPEGRGVPLRVLIAVPGATALLGLCEATIQSSRLGFHLPSFALAIAAAALVGLWPSALAALVVALADRKAPDWHGRVTIWLERAGGLAAPLVVAVAGGLGAWWLVPKTVALFQRRSADFAESLVVLWRGVAVIAIPLAFVFAYLIARIVERVVAPKWRRWVGSGAALALVVGSGLHLSSGPFVNYYGTLVPAIWWPMAAIAIATLVPARLEGSKKPRSLGVAVGLALVIGMGLFGLHHTGSRALLLHDTRAFPRLFDPMVSAFDGDDDGDLPRWLGGTDCDGTDPEVSGLRPEVPGNGVDDNCRDGDAPALPKAGVIDTTGGADRLPVVLISIDAVRADHVGLYGYERDTMPFLSHYATQSATVFERAYSPSNHTTFSMLSILSGQSPEFLMHTPHSFNSGGQRFTHWIPQRFKAAGYETWAVSPALLPTGELSAETSYFDRVKIGPWDHSPKNRGTHAKQIFDWLTAALEDREEQDPLFLWIHVPDPHGFHESHRHFGDGTLGDSPNAYDDELRWSDLHIAHLLSVLHDKWGEQFVFAVTSDHGEAFGERGEFGHGYSLYEDQIHVPLIVAAPGLAPGRRPEVVSLVGLGPALLELAGISTQGTNTAPSLLDPGAPVVAACPYFFGEKRYDVALVDERYKIIRNRSRATEVLFDLELDPDESNNIAARQPEVLEQMRAKLDAALETLQ